MDADSYKDSPLRYGFCFFSKCNKAIATPIRHLLFSCLPFNISRTIWAAVINTAQSILPTGAGTYRIVKFFKRCELADNASALRRTYSSLPLDLYNGSLSQHRYDTKDYTNLHEYVPDRARLSIQAATTFRVVAYYLHPENSFNCSRKLHTVIHCHLFFMETKG